MSTVSGVSGSSSSSSSSTSKTSMSSEDFINVMLKELQQQDPLDPTDSNQLLTQMAQISQLQSNTQLMETLEDTSLKQSIGSASNLIGQYVIGKDSSGDDVEGLVTSIAIQNGDVNLELHDGNTLPMNNITNIYQIYSDDTSSSDTSSGTSE